MKTIFSVLTVALLLASCATGYGQKSFFSGGFEDTQLGPDIFRVSFSGNDSTSMARTKDFALLRSAELALENGYPYFVVVDEQEWVEEVQAVLTDGSPGDVPTYIKGNEPRASTTIQLLKTKDGVRGVVYDAQFLVDSLKTKYEIGEK